MHKFLPIIFLCLICSFWARIGVAEDRENFATQIIWSEGEISPKEALTRFGLQNGLVSFKETQSDSLKFRYELANDSTLSYTNPGSYWVKLTLSKELPQSCICFEYSTKDTINHFSKLIVYQLEEGKLVEPIATARTGGEVNIQNRSLPFSRTCVLIPHEGLIRTDSLSLLVNLFRFRYYEDNIMLFFAQPEEEAHKRDKLLSTYFPRYAVIIAFCAILFFSFLYFLMQYVQAVLISSPGKDAYFWYCLFLLFTCIYHLEHLEWDSLLGGWFSYTIAWHYYYEVPLVVGIYLSYLHFFVHFCEIQDQLALPFFKRIKQFLFIIPLIDIGLREVWGVHTAMLGYDFYRIGLYVVLLSFLYYSYPSVKRDPAKGKGERLLKKLVFWGCLCLILGSGITISFKIPAMKELKDGLGLIWGREINYTRLGILIENLFFIAAFAYKQRLEIEEHEELKREKSEVEHLMGIMKHQLTRSRVAQHTMTHIIEILEEHRLKNKNLIHKVHAFIRKQYENSLEEKISLAEELDQINSYLELQRLRIPDLRYELELISAEAGQDFDPSYFQVPPSFLFPYIENAVDHGLFPKPIEKGEKLVKITIEEKEKEQLWYRIEDTGVGISLPLSVSNSRDAKKSTGTMLGEEYLRSHRYAQRVSLLKEEDIVKGTSVDIYPFTAEKE